MPRVERVRGRGLIRGIGRFDTGDRADVSEDDAEYLVEENGDFRYVDGPPSDDTDEADSASEGTSSEDSNEDSIEDAPSDGDDPDPDPPSEAAALADEHWQRAVATIEDGGADAYLDELESADDRDSVQKAIEERRAELEG